MNAFQCDACGSVVDDQPPNKYSLGVKYAAKVEGRRNEFYSADVRFEVQTKKPWSLWRSGRDDSMQLCGPCLADGLEKIVTELRDGSRWAKTILVDRREERLDLDATGRAQFLRGGS